MRHTATRMSVATLAYLSLFGTAIASGQGTAVSQRVESVSVPAAFALLQSGDTTGAARMLEAITAREPANARAWAALGSTYQQLKNYDAAMAAFTKQRALQPDAPAPAYNIAAVYARKQDSDHAFEWLHTAVSLNDHKMDMTQIQADSDFASLWNDPRLAAALPGASFFANPFVEPVKIIREWDGDAMRGQFGWIARDIGDVDGDRVHDFVTSAPTRDIKGARAGRVYVYSSRTGKLLWSADGKPGDRLGIGIEAAGDVNRDGIPDLIASAPGAGEAYVYSGKDGHVLLTMHAEAKSDAFGRNVSGVGDMDGDGYPDLIVGAPANNAAGKGAGRAYVYSGKDGHVLLTLTGEAAGDGFGNAVAGGTDGRHPFLIVGAPSAGPAHAGRTYVYRGLSQKPAFIVESDSTGAALGGMFASVPGDVDGDGTPDIYVTDFSNNARGQSTGRAYVRSGADGHPLLTLTGEHANDGFGIGAATTGDVDHDGHADLVIGSWQYSLVTPSGGKVYLYSGKDGHVLKEYTGRIPGETLGFDAVGIGDVDGDGVTDLLVTSAWSGVHGFQSGRLFIISSGVPSTHK